MDRKDAWKFIKADMPKESTSKSDFSAKSAPVNTKKKVEDLSAEEAANLNKEDYKKWYAKNVGF